MKNMKIWFKRASGSIETAIKVVTAVVLGALILLGLYAVVNGLVVTATQDKIESLYNTPFATAEIAEVGGTSNTATTQVYNNESFDMESFEDATFNSCEIQSSSLTNCTLTSCSIINDSLENCVVTNSNLQHSSAMGCTFSGNCNISDDGMFAYCTFTGSIIVSSGTFTENPTENGCTLAPGRQVITTTQGNMTLYRVIQGQPID